MQVLGRAVFYREYKKYLRIMFSMHGVFIIAQQARLFRAWNSERKWKINFNFMWTQALNGVSRIAWKN